MTMKSKGVSSEILTSDQFFVMNKEFKNADKICPLCGNPSDINTDSTNRE